MGAKSASQKIGNAMLRNITNPTPPRLKVGRACELRSEMDSHQRPRMAKAITNRVSTRTDTQAKAAGNKTDRVMN
jgi:hypothetical protein